MCCSPWGYKELDMTKRLNLTDTGIKFNIHHKIRITYIILTLRVALNTRLYIF